MFVIMFASLFVTPRIFYTLSLLIMDIEPSGVLCFFFGYLPSFFAGVVLCGIIDKEIEEEKKV